MYRIDGELQVRIKGYRMQDLYSGGFGVITVPMSCGVGGVSWSYLVPCIGVGECQCPNLGVEWRDSSVNV